MNEDDVLDREALDRLEEWGGPELLGKMVELFLGVAPERMTSIRDGYAAGNADAVERGAHSLKSSAGNLGAEGLRVLCARIERAAEAVRMDEVEGLLPELEIQYEKTLNALRKIRDEEAG